MKPEMSPGPGIAASAGCFDAAHVFWVGTWLADLFVKHAQSDVEARFKLIVFFRDSLQLQDCVRAGTRV